MLPRILVIDDFFGRSVPGGNRDRENLCASFLWRDMTVDSNVASERQKILAPIAEVCFCRGQTPIDSPTGTVVENDLVGAIEAVRNGWFGALSKGDPPWSLILVDLCFYTGRVTLESSKRSPGVPEGCEEDADPTRYFGLVLLDTIHREIPDAPLLVFSSKPRGEVSLEFSRRGALGFVGRGDVDGPSLFAEALIQHGLLPDPDGDIVGTSLPLLLTLRDARRAAGHRMNLLLRGERGTGKESLATYVHRATERINGSLARPYVAVNSAVLRSDLFSAELFGIEARTATGVDGKEGLIESASGGDLFLDEIADLAPEAQAALLRCLQDRKITRIGGRSQIVVDVRFISATNAELEDDERGFRPDLLDRLRLGGTLTLPSLRERLTDIPALVEKFVREAEVAYPGTVRRTVSLDAIECLELHAWPGNIRELRACIFDAVTRFPGIEFLLPNHLRLSTTGPKPVLPEKQVHGVTEADITLDDVLGAIRTTQFSESNIVSWSGRLDELQKEQTRMVARYLQAALAATRRRSSASPTGTIQIHPAIKLLTGNDQITASRAADLIKRLLSPLEGDLAGDLQDAYKTALRLRPRSANPVSEK